MEGVRRPLAVLALLVLAVSLASPLQPAEMRARFERLKQAISGDAGYRADRASFWFDPDYAAFLDDVKRRTPSSATIAVLVPALPDLYRDQALYRLAPRRVVEEKWMNEADVVATYRTETARGPGGIAISGGELWTR